MTIVLSSTLGVLSSKHGQRSFTSLGKSLANTLGSATVALMRGHGSVAVGTSIKQVVYRAIYTEANAKLQLESMKIGSIEFLTEGEALATSAMADIHLERPWALWKEKALAKLN